MEEGWFFPWDDFAENIAGSNMQHKSECLSKDDILDKLAVEWRRELPNLRVDSLGVVGRIQYLGNEYERNANKVLKEYDLKYTDFDVIGALRRSGAPFQLTPTQLCETVLITSGAMTAAIDRLERAGFVRRVPDESDRRIRAATLTKAGIDISEKAAEARFNEADKSVTGLNQNEKNQLILLLKKLIASSQYTSNQFQGSE